MPSQEFVSETLEHKRLVAEYMQRIASELFRRAAVHDNSKFEPEEADVFDRVTPKLKTLVYGTDEYKESLKELGPALQHHYESNTHHPEHYEDGVNDMSLLDVVEMVCDWMAAVKRMKDGNILTSLDINKKRFNISDQLFDVICETVGDLRS